MPKGSTRKLISAVAIRPALSASLTRIVTVDPGATDRRQSLEPPAAGGMPIVLIMPTNSPLFAAVSDRVMRSRSPFSSSSVTLSVSRASGSALALASVTPTTSTSPAWKRSLGCSEAGLVGSEAKTPPGSIRLVPPMPWQRVGTTGADREPRLLVSR
ncbi:hypothetical protein [Sphingopyxis sp. PET50]|uniref:hypothetical protein n=1 Tax=Sphingopyxis sp. PET50 TaxID=2976533 RepID=UPI0021B05F95|nr:hypothetical protein [Sphingopyxis sp. PET50]